MVTGVTLINYHSYLFSPLQNSWFTLLLTSLNVSLGLRWKHSDISLAEEDLDVVSNVNITLIGNQINYCNECPKWHLFDPFSTWQSWPAHSAIWQNPSSPFSTCLLTRTMSIASVCVPVLLWLCSSCVCASPPFADQLMPLKRETLFNYTFHFSLSLS